MLSPAQWAQWNNWGFLIVPGFFTETEIEVVESALADAWDTRPFEVVVDDLVTNQRKHMSDVSDDDRANHRFKINNLYLTRPDIRRVALSERIGTIVGELLDDVPVVCNTLNMREGSQQGDHLDTLYMTPRTPDKLVATWMALEDVAPGAGPLRYWPGSNHIPNFRFSNGGMNLVPQEFGHWVDYMAEQTDRRGLERIPFRANRGDLFIWHAFLLHGGCEISEPSLTRSSLVTHFWARADCRRAKRRRAPGGEWLARAPNHVPGDPAAEEITPTTKVRVARLAGRVRRLAAERSD